MFQLSLAVNFSVAKSTVFQSYVMFDTFINPQNTVQGYMYMYVHCTKLLLLFFFC